MAPTRFAALARAFAPCRTRRAVVRLAAGALLALDVATRPGAVAAHRQRQCAHGETKCKQTCCRRGDICAQGSCVTGQGACKAGVDAGPPLRGSACSAGATAKRASAVGGSRAAPAAPS